MPEILHVVFAEHGVADGVRRLLLHVFVAVAEQLDEQLHALERVHLRKRLRVLGAAGEGQACVAQHLAVVRRQELDQSRHAAKLQEA